MVFTGRYAVGNLADLIHGTFSIKGILTAVAGLVVIAALLFIDWRTLLAKGKLKFNFRIWTSNRSLRCPRDSHGGIDMD